MFFFVYLLKSRTYDGTDRFLQLLIDWYRNVRFFVFVDVPQPSC